MLLKTKFAFENFISNAKAKGYLFYSLLCAMVVGASARPVSCNGLFNTEAATEAGEVFVSLYMKWFWPLIIVTLILFAITKDEKKKGIEKTVAIALACVYVVCVVGSGLITDTLATIGGWFAP